MTKNKEEFEKRLINFYTLLVKNNMSINNFEDILNKFSQKELENVSVFIEDLESKKLTWYLPLGIVQIPVIKVNDGKIVASTMVRPLLLNAFNPETFKFSLENPLSNYAYIRKFSELVFE